MNFVDTHVHLHFPDYDADREEVIQRSVEAGVGLLINVGTDIESSHAALRLAQKYPFIWAAAGIHPHDVKDAAPGSLEALGKLLEHPRVVALGEVGLDFFRDHSPREKQKEMLREFIRLHLRNKKPMVLHCRDAYDDLMAILKEELLPPYRGIIHCFSSDRSVMMRLVNLGFYISFAGPLTYKKNDALREACQACPIDRLLLETDAPFLTPQARRGKRNESCYLIETAAVAAELKRVSLERLAVLTTANAREAFGLC